MSRLKPRVFLCASALVAAAAASPAGASIRRPPPIVPSLTPAATQRLWLELVRRRRHERAPTHVADCRPLRAVFYTDADWMRVATTLAANASPCAQYFVSIPPLASDKTALRSGQASKIRALGPSFHALAEINYSGWSRWVSANNASWYDSGVEARRRMAAAGFDVAAGDTWALNELSSGVRRGDPGARQAVRDFVRGLYAGDGTLPAAKGVAFVIGLDQSTPDLSVYKSALQSWYLDSGFWQDMSAYVSDWAQELYGDVRDEAVPGAPLDARIAHLNDYFGHQLALAAAAPADAASARAFIQQNSSPLANAAWIWDSGFGFTDVPLAQMEDYVSAEVAALRTLDASAGLPADHFGFAWAPRMADGSTWTAQFASDSGTLLTRLAAAIHDSDSSPDAACAPSWCTAGLDGATFTEAWKTFATWTAQLAFVTPAAALTAGTDSGPLELQLQAGGTPQLAAAPVQVTLASSSPTTTFAAGPSGPWTSTLTLTIPAGASTAVFYYTDPNPGAPTLTATAAGVVGAAQTETVAAPGGAVPPDLRVALTADAVAPPAGATLTYVATVSAAGAGSSSSSTLQVGLPADYTATAATSDRGSSCAVAGRTVTCALGPVAPGADTAVTIAGTVAALGEQVATAVVTSLSPAEPSPADNTAILRLQPAPKAIGKPRLVGRPVVGGRLRVVSKWNRPPDGLVYQWQICTARRCAPLAGATGQGLRLRVAWAHRRVRARVTAVFGAAQVTVTSQPILIRARRG